MGETQANRRQVVRAAAVGSGLALLSALDRTSAQSTPVASGSGRIEAPAWSFAVHQLQAPYAGQMQAPPSAPPGSQFVAAEVEVANESDQALAFTPVDIRLRDAAGVEYRGGGAIGSEPMINQRNLNPGELSRGWVWFTVPEGATLSEIVYVAPGPQFRVSLTG